MLARQRLRAVVRSARVSYGEVLDFVDGNPCVASWLKKFTLAPRNVKRISGSRLNKARILCRFFKWLRVRGIVLSPQELLDLQLKKRQSSSVQDRQWLLRLVLAHTRDNPDFERYADMRKYDFFVTVKSFCDYHEVVLTTAKGVFGRKRKKKNHRKQITTSDAKKFLGHVSQRDRTICIMSLQGGLEIGAILNKFSYMWHSQVKPQLDAGCERMKIEFEERKANDTWYFTYISRDAIHELKKWLQERKRIVETAVADGKNISKEILEGEPIFITSRATPLTEDYFVSQFSKKMKGKVTTHMFRKLFKSEASVPDRGIDRNYVEFWMGRAEAANRLNPMDATGGTYDRTPEIYEKTHEKEYAKLEPYVNIYSGIQRRPLSEEDRVWMKFTDALRETLESDPDKMDALVKFVKDLPA